MIGIYKITNLLNGKSYIGQSVDIETRWKQEIRASLREKHPKNHFIRALKKYGKDNFEFSVLEECKREELDEKEIYYIDKFDTVKNGYNTAIGGRTNQRVNYDLFKEVVENNPFITDVELAKRFGIVRDTANRIRKKLNLKRTFRCDHYLSIMESHKDEIIELYNQGVAYSLICEKFKIPYGIVLDTIHETWNIDKHKTVFTERTKRILIYNNEGLFLKESTTTELKMEYSNIRLDSLANKRRCNKGLILRYYKENYPLQLKIINNKAKPWFEYWEEEG